MRPPLPSFLEPILVSDSSHPADISSGAGAPAAKDPAALDAPPKAGFRFGRVLKVVIPLGLLIGAVAAFFALRGPERLEELMRPPLAAVEGAVFYKGEPLPNAVVQTQPLRSGLRGAIASTDEEGRFRLRTDVEGTFQDGAYVGKHKLIVAAYGEPPPGPGGAPLTTPQLYASYNTTPLSLDVVNAPEQNRLRLELEGEPPSSPSPDLPAERSPTGEPDEVNSSDSSENQP
jgi:hypothetical protein